VEYKPDLQSPLLSWDFVDAVRDVVEEYSYKETSPGNLCSKVIDECERQRKVYGSGYLWPPDFQEHRDRLREYERAAEREQATNRSRTANA
jgi:hypothetical protein